jgi:PAS domain S-box-containing protein
MQTQRAGNSILTSAILCVENNEDSFELIAHHLAAFTEEGLLIERCDSLKAARSRLVKGGIETILLDLSLPDSQGIDTLKMMKLYAPDIPTIVLSGTTDFDIALESLKYGAEDYLIKDSLDTASLVRSINYAMTRHTERESSGQLAAIVESSPDAIIGKTVNGFITSWNKGAEELFGYSAAEAKGKSIAIIIPLDLPNELDEILTAIKNGDCIRNKETVRIKKSGERVDVSATITPIVRQDGTIGGAAAIDRDISERKKTQRVLQESEERYRLLVSQVKDYAIFVLDPQGLVQSWNEGAKRIKGYEAAEIIGKHISVFYTNEDQLLGVPESQLKIALTNGSFEDRGWRLRKDGARFFANDVTTPLFSADGALYGFTMVVRDITKAKLAEKETADAKLRLSMALEAAAIGVWDFDLTKNSVWRSLRHDEIFGLKNLLPEWNFDIFANYILPEDLASAKEAFRLGREEGHFRMQCRIIRADDKSIRFISVRGETFRNEHGDPVRMMGTVADITDIRQREEQLRFLAIMGEREEFMATLTHDMKNPLIGANRLLELFIAGTLGAMTTKQSEMLQCIINSNSGLLKLIGELIDVYRFEKDVSILTKADCDIASLISSCVRGTEPFARLRSIKVTTAIPEKLVVSVDAGRLERVVQNLLDNALKFAPGGGAIHIRLVNLHGQTIIEVEDNGPGIAPEEQCRLFKRFAQGNAGKRYTGGSGLGLYLCRQIVEAHGGTIECHSQPSKTTLFRVCLPPGTKTALEPLANVKE